MAYYEVTVGATATPALAMTNALDPLLTANGWQFVETYTNGTNVTTIYKSPGTANSIGTDFFIGINRTSDAATVVAPCIWEIWDATGKRAIKWAPNGTVSAGANVPAADGSIADAVGVLPSVTTAGASVYKSTFVNLATAGWTYYLNITVDRIIWTTNVGTGGGYCGVYEPFYNIDRPPLMVVTLGTGSASTNTGFGAMTREPATTNITGNWHPMKYVTSASGASMLYQSLLPASYASGQNDLFTTNPSVSQLVINHSRNPLFPLGKLKDCLVSLHAATNGLAGDTLTYSIGATSYSYVKTSHSVVSTVDCSNWIPKQ